MDGKEKRVFNSNEMIYQEEETDIVPSVHAYEFLVRSLSLSFSLSLSLSVKV